MAKVDQGMIPANPFGEARSVGPADQNESTPAVERAPDGKHIPKTDGPQRGERDEFLPAEYSYTRTMVGVNGQLQEFKVTRRDR